MSIASVNPSTGRTIQVYEPHGTGEVERRLALAAATFRTWRERPVAERTEVLSRAAELLEERAGPLGRLMTLEMGKPLAAAEAEARKCAWVCRWYAEHAARLLADEEVETDARRSFVRYAPLGPVLAVMPWNFPFWQVFRFAAPALAAGNTGLLKHASNVPGCALAIEEILAEAGVPEGGFQTLLIGSDRVEPLIADPRVAAVTLTGSEPAGRAVAAAAGRHLKKTVLELGGSDPFVVLADADLDAAVATAVRARTINNGQSCIAAKRFLVAAPVADRFEEAFTDAMGRLVVGDPLDPDTDVGPLATGAIREELHEQVRATVAEGGRLLLGGAPAAGEGYFYPPTVVADPPPGTPLRVEETFGPVAALLRFGDPDEALALANETEFGLGAAVWTHDPDLAARFVDGLEAGSVFVNGMVASDPRLPFGGVKRSGYGRELSVHGLREFLNIKTVWQGE
ncbi:MAG: NAD-dependent succinate-semialdehyde dehydrogenase [Gemmatimonadota bacterium]|nr:NAD-dependent succinate-semialdehyde dehydrogenase [Gemmatimonadota bacterium]